MTQVAKKKIDTQLTTVASDDDTEKKQKHDAYGKKVMRQAFREEYNSRPAAVSFGPCAGSLTIDGTIGKDIAVEIESRTSKQVRGAILDIVFHPYPKKLVVLIKKFGNRFTEEQCRVLLARFAPRGTQFEVVTLRGTGTNDESDRDKTIVIEAVDRLRARAIS